MADFQVKIENVTAVATLGVDLPVDKLVSSKEEPLYGPEHSEGVVYRPGEPGVAVVMYSAGKVVCTGTKSIEKAKEVINDVVKKANQAGVSVQTGFKVDISSIDASCKLNVQLDLEKLADRLPNTEYDTSKLPALVHRMPGLGVSLLLFADGKVVCTGAKAMPDIDQALHRLIAELQKAGIKA